MKAILRRLWAVFHIREAAANAAYCIVCSLIDVGYVESEPEGLDYEYKYAKIIRAQFGFRK